MVARAYKGRGAQIAKAGRILKIAIAAIAVGWDRAAWWVNHVWHWAFLDKAGWPRCIAADFFVVAVAYTL